MEVALLVGMRIKVGFDQGGPINGINFKIVCRCCGMNVFKDSDEDSKGLISSFGTLGETLLSLLMACYNHRLKLLVMLGTIHARI